MSRAVFLNMSEKAIILHCESEKIGISVISKLSAGGTRLVCMGVQGAEQVRRKLKAQLMKGDVATVTGPVKLWPPDVYSFTESNDRMP